MAIKYILMLYKKPVSVNLAWKFPTQINTLIAFEEASYQMASYVMTFYPKQEMMD